VQSGLSNRRLDSSRSTERLTTILFLNCGGGRFLKELLREITVLIGQEVKVVSVREMAKPPNVSAAKSEGAVRRDSKSADFVKGESISSPTFTAKRATRNKMEIFRDSCACFLTSGSWLRVGDNLSLSDLLVPSERASFLEADFWPAWPPERSLWARPGQ